MLEGMKLQGQMKRENIPMTEVKKFETFLS